MRPLVLIAGGTGAIGEATANLMAPDHDFALVYKEHRLRATGVKDRLESTHHSTRVTLFESRLFDYDTCRSLFENVYERCGRSPDVLITLPGGLYDGLYLQSVFEEHSSLLSNQLIVPMALCHLALKHMYMHRFGRIVNVGSIASRYIKRGQSSYAAAKAGLVAFTKSLALEVAHRGVTANVVEPGLIHSDFAAPYIKGLQEDGIGVSNRIPVGFVGAPLDVARVIQFLCAAESSYITGSVYTVDGGRSLGDPQS